MNKNPLNLELPEFDLNSYVPESERIKEKQIFDPDTSEYTRAYFNKLVEMDLIEKYTIGPEADEVTQEEIIKLVNYAMPFKVEQGNGKVYYELEGNKIFIDESKDEKLQKENISDLLPDVIFDVIQGGILEKAKEAEAIYKVIAINNIYGGVWTPDSSAVFIPALIIASLTLSPGVIFNFDFFCLRNEFFIFFNIR